MDFDEAMCESQPVEGHIEIIKLCESWGAVDFDERYVV